MTRSIDRNDVDITQLFVWKKEVKIEDVLNGVTATVYLRLVGDEDIGKARAYSFRKSAELRNKLKTPGTDEYEAFMNTEMDFQEIEALVNAVVFLKATELSEQVKNNVSVPEPTEPKDNATLEQMEEYQRLVDEYPQKYSEAIQKEMEKVLKKELENHAKLSRPELEKMYKDRIINRLCTEEVNKTFYEMVVYLATFLDEEHTRRAFKSLSAFSNSSTALKKRLIDEYQSLELGMDFLKKLPGVTQ